MTSTVRKLAATAVLASAAFGASAAHVVTFDDLSGTHYFNTSYMGLTFGTNPTANCQCGAGSWFWSDSDASLAASGSTSISTVADGSSTMTESLGIKSASQFYFDGAYFASLSDGNTVAMNYYLNGQLVGGSDYLSDLNIADGSVFLDAGYHGLIDEIRVVGFQGTFAMDNLKVPEPASAALVLAAIAGLTATRRRSANKG